MAKENSKFESNLIDSGVREISSLKVKQVNNKEKPLKVSTKMAIWKLFYLKAIDLCFRCRIQKLLYVKHVFWFFCFLLSHCRLQSGRKMKRERENAKYKIERQGIEKGPYADHP